MVELSEKDIQNFSNICLEESNSVESNSVDSNSVESNSVDSNSVESNSVDCNTSTSSNNYDEGCQYDNVLWLTGC